MTFRVKEVGSRSELMAILREVRLLGHETLKPYEDATITVEPVSIDLLVPLSKYVLEEQLESVRNLEQRLMAEAGVDLYQLAGRITWSGEEAEHHIAPPVVELSADATHELVDGLHRAWIGGQSGRTAIQCAVIRDVSLPLVPLPVTWDAVRTYPRGQRPSELEKRDFRFAAPEEVKAVVGPLGSAVTEENFRYFLFRDLSILGSKGIRPVSTSREGLDSERDV